MNKDRLWCIVIILCVECIEIFAEDIDGNYEEDEDGLKGLEKLENWVLGKKI